jgi:translation initiation factor IF-2
VGKGEKIKTKNIKSSTSKSHSQQAENHDSNEKQKKLNIIIKSDVLGSAEAIEESLAKISTEDVMAKIIHKGLGYITEGDISKAEGANAQIVGFHIKITPKIEELIREKKVAVKIFEIIYDLIEYVKKEMQELIEPEFVRVDLGRLKVLALFRSEPGKEVIGGKVLDGQIELDSLAEIWRDKEIIGTCTITKLQSGKQDVKKVDTNQECGLQCEGDITIEEGDIIKSYKEEKTIKKL